jgi:DNA polymerase-3 subunit gamma/tau
LAKALYQKYRSQTFDELIGQEHISKILKNAVKQQSFSHAYLFIGSRGTGKTSTARILAKAINCKNPTADGNPCNVCTNCISITQGNFLDLIEIDAASNRGIDQIRALKEKIEFTPSEGRYKIYIIDEVHMLTNEAFNALLKTLEEPPAHVIFMLATTESHKVPATIVSRCQRYDFRLGSDDEIKRVITNSAKYEGVKLAPGAVKLLVQNARGSYRDSLSLLDVVIAGQLQGEHPNEVTVEEVQMVLGLPDTTMVYYFLEKLIFGDGEASLKLIEELDSKGVNLQHFVRSTIEVLRQILVKNIQGKVRETEFSFAYDLDRGQILQLLNLFINADKNLKSATIPALVLEMLIPQFNDRDQKTERPKDRKVEEKHQASSIKDRNKVEEIKIVAENVSAPDTIEILNSKFQNSKEQVEKIETKVESKREKEEVSQSVEVDKDVKLTLTEIEDKWKDVTREIKEANGHLFAFLQAAHLLSFENSVLVMQVAYEFHKERIESMKSREAILDIFKKVFGVKFLYKCEVNTQIKVRRQVGPEIILSQNAIETNKIVSADVSKATAPETNTSVPAKAENAPSIETQQEEAKPEKPKFIFKKGLGRDVEELFAGL